jgi:tetratricopeptide (TPR) repeat protein
MRRAWVSQAVALFLVGGFVSPGGPVVASSVQAQERSPLQKSEVVRLLTSGTYSEPEVITIIQQNCLSFAPTARDRTDFRALGASQAILDEIDECADRGPDRPEAAVAGAVIQLRSQNWEATVGGEAVISAYFQSGGAPVSAERLILTGATEIEGGSGVNPIAETGADGQAEFRISAGTVAREYTLFVQAMDRPSLTPSSVSLRVAAGAPAVADAEDVVLDPSAGPVSLRLVVRDSWGNPVPGAPLVLLAGDEDGDVLFEGATASDGGVSVRLPEAALIDVPRVTVLSGETRLAALAVTESRRPASIIILSGGSQVAEAGQTLASPLVLEVRDADGDPVPGAVVSLAANQGTVQPLRAAADANGQVSVVVGLGPSGSETVVRVNAGSVTRDIRFSALSEGRSVAEIEADLDEADRYLAAGEIAAAQALYDDVAQADPLNRRATLGRSRVALASNRPAEAAGWAEAVLRQQPEDAEAWVDLGNARAALGDEDAAQFAYEQSLLLDPGNEEAVQALAALTGATVTGSSEPLVAVDVWGGTTVDDDRGFGLPYAEVRVVPASWIALRVTYDDMLSLRHPYLVRGRDALQSIYGAAALRWGSDHRFETTFEMGRRDQPKPDNITADLYQTSWLLEQAIPLSGSSTLRFGGWLGRWYDRDDMAVYGEALFELGSGLALRPMLSWADNAGSNVTGDDGEPGTGRDPETEIRGGLGVRYENGSSWGLEPVLAYGSVDSEDAVFDGGLFDFTTRAWVRFSPVISANGFVRYQSPPGTPSFVTVALGIGFAIQ